jgi:ribosomal protein S18 acetylase RimI-like enzyme
MGLSGADEPESLARFVATNGGLCWSAFTNGRLVGTILCGSDGRRGYLYHVAVQPELRSRGIGRELVERALRALRERGIEKCHAMVYADNAAGRGFWSHVGWRFRNELVLFSRNL